MTTTEKIRNLLISYRDGCHDSSELRMVAEYLIDSLPDFDPQDTEATTRMCDYIIKAARDIQEQIVLLIEEEE